jgi:hypothetical protein
MADPPSAQSLSRLRTVCRATGHRLAVILASVAVLAAGCGGEGTPDHATEAGLPWWSKGVF